MKKYLLILPLLLTFNVRTVFAESAMACDLDQLENEYVAEYRTLQTKIESAMAKADDAKVDMSAYTSKVDKYRACQKATDPKSVSPCGGFSVWGDKKLSPNFTLSRLFDIVQNRSGACVQDTGTFQYVLLNKKNLQILYARNGSIVMTHVIPGKAKGIPTGTGRTFLFSDGVRTGKSGLFVIDFPEPLDRYDISLFWGLDIVVGNGTHKLETIVQGTNLTFQWSNGAFITIESISEEIIDSNFLAPLSYKAICETDQDVSPKGRTRYFPMMEFLPGAERLIKEPIKVQ